MEKHVTSLELSKRLKELGVHQKSLFWHELNNIDGGIGTGEMVYSKDMSVPVYYSYGYISSFLASELGEMLPRYIADKDQPLSGVKGKQYPLIIECLADDYSSDNKINGWRIRYGDTKVKVDSEYKLNSAGIYYVGSEADARAKMLIYLLEQRIINVEDINK